MPELDKLKQLLDELMIDYEEKTEEGRRCIVLIDKLATIWTDKDGLRIFGWGFSGIWTYSAEFVARMLDRKFREEAVNNQYLLRMQKEGAENEPERKTVRKSRMRKKGNRRNRSKSSR